MPTLWLGRPPTAAFANSFTSPTLDDLNERFIFAMASPYVVNLPRSVEVVYIENYGKPWNWIFVVQVAVKTGEDDPDKLADIPFYLHHTELMNRSLKSHEKELIKEWLAWRETVKALIPELRKPQPPPPFKNWLERLNPDDLNMLFKVHHTPEHKRKRREDLKRMRKYLIRALSDSSYDPTYWRYEYYDFFGRNRKSVEKGHQVEAVKRLSPRVNAVEILKRHGKAAHSHDELGKILVTVEKYVYDHTDVIIRWTFGTAANDGSMSGYRELDYLSEMARLSKKEESIYSVYKDLLQARQSAMHDPNPKTAGVPW